MIDEKQITRFRNILMYEVTHKDHRPTEQELEKLIRSGVQAAQKIDVFTEEDTLRFLKLLFVKFELLQSEIRREYFLRILLDADTASENRLKMLELIAEKK